MAGKKRRLTAGYVRTYSEFSVISKLQKHFINPNNPISVKTTSNMSKMNKNRPSQPEISHIKELLHQIMTGVRRPDNDDIHQIQRIWDDMLGQSITRHARPVALEKGILIIHVDSSTITQQLRFQVKMMIRQINQRIGHERVMDLRFKISNA